MHTKKTKEVVFPCQDYEFLLLMEENKTKQKLSNFLPTLLDNVHIETNTRSCLQWVEW